MHCRVHRQQRQHQLQHQPQQQHLANNITAIVIRATAHHSSFNPQASMSVYE